MKIFNKLLFISILVFAVSCQDDDEEINPVNNGSINDVVGTWNYIGDFDSNDNSITTNSPQSNCQSQDFMILESNGNASFTGHYLENEIDGDCISESQAFQFIYINSSTLTFITPSICGNATIELNNNQIKWFSCNADNETYMTDYRLFEKQ